MFIVVIGRRQSSQQQQQLDIPSHSIQLITNNKCFVHYSFQCPSIEMKELAFNENNHELYFYGEVCFQLNETGIVRILSLPPILPVSTTKSIMPQHSSSIKQVLYIKNSWNKAKFHLYDNGIIDVMHVPFPVKQMAGSRTICAFVTENNQVYYYGGSGAQYVKQINYTPYQKQVYTHFTTIQKQTEQLISDNDITVQSVACNERRLALLLSNGSVYIFRNDDNQIFFNITPSNNYNNNRIVQLEGYAHSFLMLNSYGTVYNCTEHFAPVYFATNSSNVTVEHSIICDRYNIVSMKVSYRINLHQYYILMLSKTGDVYLYGTERICFKLFGSLPQFKNKRVMDKSIQLMESPIHLNDLYDKVSYKMERIVPGQIQCAFCLRNRIGFITHTRHFSDIFIDSMY
jgi:hypothetical protein